MRNLKFTLIFDCLSGLHITGDRAELWVDKPLILDSSGKCVPIIPATTIKGWLRENMERLLRSMGLNSCDASQPSEVCGKCLVCEIFGHPRQRSPIRFKDGIIVNPITSIRTSVSLSRFRKTSFEKRLFTAEIAWPSEVIITGDGFFTEESEAKLVAHLLYMAAKFGFAIGGAKSRGLGWLKFKNFEAKYGEKDIELTTEIANIKKLVRGEKIV